MAKAWDINDNTADDERDHHDGAGADTASGDDHGAATAGGSESDDGRVLDQAQSDPNS